MRRFLVPILASGAVALCGAAIAVADSANNPKADILQGNASCGFSDAGPVIGFTNFHRIDDSTVMVEYHLKDARPDTTYHVELWGGVCSFFGDVGDVTTNDQGVANGNGSVAVPQGVTRFFATSWDANPTFEFNDTPAVTLP